MLTSFTRGTSLVEIAELARSIVEEIPTAPEAIYNIASLGTWGGNDFNVERDLHRLTAGLYGSLLETYNLDLVVDVGLIWQRRGRAVVS